MFNAKNQTMHCYNEKQNETSLLYGYCLLCVGTTFLHIWAEWKKCMYDLLLLSLVLHKSSIQLQGGIFPLVFLLPSGITVTQSEN